MVKLTERLVLARTRASDLDNVRKLNCWASDLTDVSIIKKMQNVQIVSLSVNHITSLQDFAESMSMEELYIRKNNIANLAEIYYLRKLPRLRVLWLADNPCAVGDRYRMTVLKALPNLQRLDNIPVQEDEVNEAIEQGLDLTPLAETLKSMKFTPESSPVQIRKSKKFKEKKELENTEEKQTDKDKEETEQTQERVIEKVLELEGGGVEREAKQTKDLETNESKDEEPEETKDEAATEEMVCEEEIVDSVASAPDTDREPTPDTPTTEGSKVSPSEDSEEKGKDQIDTPTEEEVEEESDDIEEGEITIENPIQETNEIRARLGLKPLAAEKVSQPTHSRPSTGTKARNANILQAVLHLIRELDGDSLQVVSDVVRSKLEAL